MWKHNRPHSGTKARWHSPLMSEWQFYRARRLNRNGSRSGEGRQPFQRGAAVGALQRNREELVR